MPDDHQFNLQSACKLGRILGGHDPLSDIRDMSPLPASTEPVTMEEIRYAAALDAIAKTGNKDQAAARLQISKGQFYDIIKRRRGRKVVLNSTKIVKLSQVAALILFLCLCASVANAQPALPKSIKTDTNAAPQALVATNLLPTLPAPEPLRNGSVTLAWNPSPDASVTGYRLYWGGTPGAYTNSAAVGKALTSTVRNLIEDVTYYFAVTAYDSTGVESPFSNETSYKAGVEVALSMSGWTISSPGYFGRTNELVICTNLSASPRVWQVMATYVGDGKWRGVNHTNTSAASFRVRLKGQP